MDWDGKREGKDISKHEELVSKRIVVRSCKENFINYFVQKQTTVLFPGNIREQQGGGAGDSSTAIYYFKCGKNF